MRTVLLDPGHGGVIKGIPQTAGKRSDRIYGSLTGLEPNRNGFVLYEGEFTRDIVSRIMHYLTYLGIPYVNIVPELEDISLAKRVRRANSFEGKSVYVSVHSNAASSKQAHGFEVFTSKGQTKSDICATYVVDAFKEVFPNVRVRSDYADGDPDKEANYYVLKNTKMPAVLTESFFMTNDSEVKKYLITPGGRDRIARYHVKAIQKMVKLA